MTELERFCSLFDQQVRHTWETVAPLGPEQWSATTVETSATHLGARVKRITVEALVRHLCLVERAWLAGLAQVPEGAEVPPPAMDALDNVVGGPELLSFYRDSHERGLAALRAYDQATLERPVLAMGRRFTIQGFLWALYGHHCYHFGHIDLLMRQQDVAPPEFIELPERQRVIA